MSYQIFVYGTLLRGERNHHVIERSRYVGHGCTRCQFRLVDLVHFPAMVPGNMQIDGDVYEVDDRTLMRLDRLEGHPSFYQRTVIELDDGRHVYAYLMRAQDVAGARTIKTGSWKTRRPNP